ncbi:MAG: SGNH/GDSL hydrolase family protein [Clostridia bacterium]|nr:SGNH/GDSL hydrolase family protein [Clostridia bacterium]
MKLCFFGDSIGKGIVYDAGRERYVPSDSSFVRLIEQEQSCAVDNFSRFGCTVTRGAALIAKHTDSIEESDYVFLEFGGNDSDFNWQEIAEEPEAVHNPRTPLDLFVSTYRKIVDGIRDLGKTPVILNLPPIDARKYFTRISRGLSAENILRWLGGDALYIYHWHEMYNAAVCAIGRATGALLIDIRSAFLAKRNIADYLCEDGIHPNEQGHRLICDTLRNAADGSCCVSSPLALSC